MNETLLLEQIYLKLSDRFDFVRRRVLSLSNLLIRLYVAATIAALRTCVISYCVFRLEAFLTAEQDL